MIANVLNIGHVLLQLTQIQRVFADQHLLLLGADFQAGQLLVQIQGSQLVFQIFQIFAQFTEETRVHRPNLRQLQLGGE